jgi:hypothetical protein
VPEPKGHDVGVAVGRTQLAPDRQRSAAYGRPERQRWITMPGPEQIPGLRAKGKPIWSDVIELREKAPRDRFQDQVLQLTLTEQQEAFVSGEQ